jgi:hypothetical protein
MTRQKTVLAHVVYFNHDEGRNAAGVFFDEPTAQKFQTRCEQAADKHSMQHNRRRPFTPSDDHYSTHAEYVVDKRHPGGLPLQGQVSRVSMTPSYVYAVIDTLDTFFHHMERIEAIYSTAYAAYATHAVHAAHASSVSYAAYASYASYASYDCKDIAVFASDKGRMTSDIVAKAKAPSSASIWMDGLNSPPSFQNLFQNISLL